MNILAVDTSTNSCSVALLNGRRLLAEQVFTAGRTHSRHLMSLIHEILARCECEPGDLYGIAVTRGPGTFTGLRIGISTVKGLGAAIGKPVVGVNSLSALAYPLVGRDCPVVSMIDARRGEIYHACYYSDAGSAESEAGAMVSAPEAVLADLPEEAILVGSGAVLYRDVFATRSGRVRFADETTHVIRASSVGMLAMSRFETQTAGPADALVPEYIRKSDAQIQMSGSC